MSDSIRARLIALVVAVVLPLAVLAAYQIHEAAAEQRKAALSQLQQLLAAVSVESSRLHRDAHWLLARLAASAGVQQLDPAVCEQHGDLRMFRREFVNLVLLGGSGDFICSALPVPPGNVVFDRPTFEAAMQGAGTHAGNVIAGTASGQPIVVFAHPVSAADGRRIGLLSMTVGTRYFEGLLRELAFG